MSDLFKNFRIFGFLPYKIINNVPVYSPKWRIYSCLTLILLLIVQVCLLLMKKKYFTDSKDPKFIYLVILEFEPVFTVTHSLVIFYTVLSKIQTRKTIKILEQLLEAQSWRKVGESRWERKMFWWTFGPLGILLILTTFSEWQKTILNSESALLRFIDWIACYTYTAVNTVEVVQFCVYFKLIIDGFTELEINLNELDLIEIFVKIQKLKKLRNNIEDVYYPNFLFLKLNCLFYCILGFRGVYDLDFQDCLSLTLSLIIVVWVVLPIPFQFYLMHLSDVIETKVISIVRLCNFFIV